MSLVNGSIKRLVPLVCWLGPTGIRLDQDSDQDFENVEISS